MVNAAGDIELVNAHVERMFGYSREELLGKPVETLVPERFRRHHPSLRKSFFDDPASRPMGAGRDLYAMRKDGAEFPVEIGLNPIKMDDQTMALSAIVDISDRKQNEQAAQRLAAIVESSSDAIISKDLNGIITTWNHGAMRLFGYAASEIVGEPITVLIPPEHRHEEQLILGRLCCGQPIEHYETVRRHKDGSLIDISLTVSPIKDARGIIIGASKIARGISDRKDREQRIREALQEKNVLLSEIHHRVKNNLQIVHGLLALQNERIKDPLVLSMLRDGQNRIRSMALIHQTLYESHDFSGVDFRDFLDALLPTLISSYGVDPARISLRVNAVAVLLPINSAIPCGLVVNELISNALKHAFPGAQRGEITVELGNGGDGKIILSVSDNGIGISDAVDVDQSATLGLQLVNLLSQQLNADLHVRRSNPTRFELRFAI
jgi:PAS domain S-box-containing protein